MTPISEAGLREQVFWNSTLTLPDSSIRYGPSMRAAHFHVRKHRQRNLSCHIRVILPSLQIAQYRVIPSSRIIDSEHGPRHRDYYTFIRAIKKPFPESAQMPHSPRTNCFCKKRYEILRDLLRSDPRAGLGGLCGKFVWEGPRDV